MADEAAFVAAQLWPQHGWPDYQVLDDVDPPPGWVAIEHHWALGRGGRITLLLPVSRRAASGALASYPGLRTPGRRAARASAALGVRLGVLRPRRRLTLATRLERTQRSDTVLEQLRASTGLKVGAVMHVRRTANRKALLQVVDEGGRTLGYAKVARDATTSRGIRKEIEMLEDLDGGSHGVRVPRVLATGTTAGLPYVFTEALPRDIRRVRASIAGAPSAAECVSLAPLARWAPPAESGHVQGLGRRAAAVLVESGNGSLVQPVLRDLLRATETFEAPVPVAKWWHGDFSFWNAGRTPMKTLWVWDFENAERDALAGLDIVHWHASRRRHRLGAKGLCDRTGILTESASILRAYGADGVDAQHAVFCVYIAEIVTRTLETAKTEGWSRVWCRPEELVEIAKAALA